MCVLVAACGDDSQPSSADAAFVQIDASVVTDAAGADAMPVTLASFCSADGLFGRYYARLLTCYPEVQLDLGYQPTNQDLSGWCVGLFGDYIADGSMTLPSQATIDQCLAYMDQTQCIDVQPDRPGGPCAYLFVGTVPLGQGCEWELQCAGMAYCQRIDDNQCGTCVPKKADGQLCDNSEHCESLACDDGVCVSPGLEGTQCSSDKACLGQRTCDQATGRCVAPAATNYLARGADCSSGGQCDRFAYDTCDGSTCVAPTIAQAGQVCSVDAGLKCADGLICTDALDSGVCVNKPQEGDSCGSGSECGGLLRCENNTCSYNDYDGTCTAP